MLLVAQKTAGESCEEHGSGISYKHQASSDKPEIMLDNWSGIL